MQVDHDGLAAVVVPAAAVVLQDPRDGQLAAAKVRRGRRDLVVGDPVGVPPGRDWSSRCWRRRRWWWSRRRRPGRAALRRGEGAGELDAAGAAGADRPSLLPMAATRRPAGRRVLDGEPEVWVIFSVVSLAGKPMQPLTLRPQYWFSDLECGRSTPSGARLSVSGTDDCRQAARAYRSYVEAARRLFRQRHAEGAGGGGAGGGQGAQRELVVATPDLLTGDRRLSGGVGQRPVTAKASPL